MVFRITDTNFRLRDMNSYTPDASGTRKGWVWEKSTCRNNQK
jgi:hypothetical protein